MVSQLINIVRFTGLVVGVPTTLPHGLNNEGNALVPDSIAASASDFSPTATDTLVRVTRGATAPASVDVLVQHWYSEERIIGPQVNLTPQPFVFGAGSGGGGGGSGWQLQGNAGINPLTDFVGTTDPFPLRFGTNGAERARFDQTTGFFGIGTITSAAARLHVAGGVLFEGIPLPNFPAGGSIGPAASTVDIVSTISIFQTTPGQTLVIPPPTIATDGRLLIVHSVGTTSFTMQGQTIAVTQGAIFSWNGALWAPCGAISTGGGGGGWSLTGNGATGPANFIGTTDAQPLQFATNNSVKASFDVNGFFLPREGITNTSFGRNSGQGTGGGNASYGTNALASITNSNANTAISFNALTNLTSGADNCALGSGCGVTVTTGSGNVLIGATADVTAGAASNRIAIGTATVASIDNGLFFPLALAAVTGGRAVMFDPLTGQMGAMPSGFTDPSQTSFGTNAGINITTGSDNTSYGANAGRLIASGSDNVAIGSAALQSNVLNDFNTAVGAAALAQNLVAEETAVGYAALAQNSTGLFNTALGVMALNANTTQLNSTGLGYHALVNATAADNTGVGARPLENCTLGNRNTGVGSSGLIGVTTGNNNCSLGFTTGTTLQTGSFNLLLGAGTDVNAAGAAGRIAIGVSSAGVPAVAAVDDGLFFPTTLAAVAVGAVVQFDAGTGQMGPVVSSQRFKTDITSLQVDSADIYKLHAVSYRRKDSALREFGYLAEEVVEVLPSIVPRDQEGKPFSVNYDRLTVLLVEEIRKLRTDLDALRLKVK